MTKEERKLMNNLVLYVMSKDPDFCPISFMFGPTHTEEFVKYFNNNY